uniref:Uncharacterized protein n=1 Tax=Arundo donax TaxID=35708 RepID=A0A0A9GP93_ARUDO
MIPHVHLDLTETRCLLHLAPPHDLPHICHLIPHSM